MAENYPSLYLVVSIERAASLKQAVDEQGAAVSLNPVRLNDHTVGRFAWHKVSKEFGDDCLTTRDFEGMVDAECARLLQLGSNVVGIVLFGPDKETLHQVDMRAMDFEENLFS